jgi:hypothetical protein
VTSVALACAARGPDTAFEKFFNSRQHPDHLPHSTARDAFVAEFAQGTLGTWFIVETGSKGPTSRRALRRYTTDGTESKSIGADGDEYHSIAV